jgi:glycosyltransferase 2 family protein
MAQPFLHAGVDHLIVELAGGDRPESIALAATRGDDGGPGYPTDDCRGDQNGMRHATRGRRAGMAMGASGEPHGKYGAVAGPPAAAPGGILPARVPGDAGRVRRPADLLLALFSLVILAVVLGSIRALPLGSTEAADDVSRWLLHIPRWLSYVAAVTSGVASFVLVIAALIVLTRSQWRDTRNAVVAGLAGAAAAIVASVVWRAEHAAVQRAVLHGSNPSTFVVDTAFVAFVVGTDLSRLSRWSRWWPRSGAALLLSGLAVGTLTPFAVVITASGGLLVGWVVRWLLAAASVLPNMTELTGWLTSQGVRARDLSVAGPSRARLEGKLADGTRIRIQLSGRDTRGSGLVRRLWALARLRPAVAGHIALGSRAQLEQLALACCLAQQASVPSPAVRLLGEMPGETLVLVTTIPDSGPEAEAAQPAAGVARLTDAASLFAALRRLHETGVAHRDVRPGNVFMSGNGAGFCSLDAAEPGASELGRRLDLVQALATLAATCGPTGAVTALRAGYGPVDQAAVAAVVQPIALAPWGWRAARAATGSLNEIRHQLLGDTGTVPAALRLERFRWRTVASTVALTVAAYLLIGEISGVNVLGTLGQANPGWLAVAVLASAMTYLGAAIGLAAFIPRQLSIWRGFFVQVSTAFVGVAMPPTVGHVAVNARYLHRQKVDEGTIAAAVTVSQLVNVVTTVLLLIVLGVLTGSGLSKFKIAPGGDVLIGLAVIAAAVIAVLAVPQTRKKVAGTVWPHLREIWPRLLDAVSHPLRLAIGAGANLLLSAAYTLALIAALWSVGAHPAILAVAVVFLAGNTVGSATPTPGGLGGVEAVLAAGLTAIGVPAHQAIPAVLLFRMATFWLPIPVGWISYLVLQRRGVL